MASGKRYTREEKDEIMEYRQTHTYRETADKYNVSQMTLARWSRRYKPGTIINDNFSDISAMIGKCKLPAEKHDFITGSYLLRAIYHSHILNQG